MMDSNPAVLGVRVILRGAGDFRCVFALSPDRPTPCSLAAHDSGSGAFR
jgi:hypothetical protein